MRTLRNDGAAVVELAIVVPLLLLLLSGACAAARTAFLRSAASSAAQAEAIRAGRRLPSRAPELASTILPGETGASVRAEDGKKAAPFSSFLPSLEGRTVGVAQAEKGWDDLGGGGSWPRARVSCRAEMSVNCWDSRTRSGRKVGNTVRAFAASAVLR